MFEDFSSEMVSQVALLLLIGIAFGLLSIRMPYR